MKTRLALAGAAAAAIALAGCGSTSLTGNAPDGADTPAPQVQADPALNAKLPEKIKSSGKIVVGTDASYAPNEFLDADGKTIIGMDIDVFDAVAAKLGVQAEWQPAAFDSIIAGIEGGRYDAGISSFNITDERKKQANMVSYFEAGTQWATAPGNPKKVDPDNACGMKVAVQTGTIQQEEDLPERNKKCGNNPIEVLTFTGQDEATAALVSGRADAMVTDSPVVAYAGQQTNGQIEALGEVYDSAPYGIIVPKDQPEYAEAIAEALTQLKADGSYDQILQKWDLADGGIDSFAVNP